MNPSDVFSFGVLGQVVAIDCPDPELRAVVSAHWSEMACTADRTESVWRIRRLADEPSLISIDGDVLEEPIHCAAVCDLLNELERVVIVDLQLRRPDLYFLHAAVVQMDQGACLLVSESGGGKSTTTWALTHHGWTYASDELAPVDLSCLRVHPYPRAISLKQPPPAPYHLPTAAICTEHLLLIPTQSIEHVARLEPLDLAAIFFVAYDSKQVTPEMCSVSPGEASARIYANALNQLAHPNRGLEAAVKLGSKLPAYLLKSAALPPTCELVRSTVQRLSLSRQAGHESP